MAHSSWKVFSSSRTSRTDDPDEVLFMLDEIPTDNESTTEEEPDSEPDNTPPLLLTRPHFMLSTQVNPMVSLSNDNLSGYLST